MYSVSFVPCTDGAIRFAIAPYGTIPPTAFQKRLSVIRYRRPAVRPAAFYLRAKAQHSSSIWAPRANPLAPRAERAGKCSGLK